VTGARSVLPFLHGLIAMGLWVAGLFFLRFWRDTRDRLFAILAAAFWTLATNFIALGLLQPDDETRHYAYVVRLAAFLLIIGGVVDKNRRDS
jgi:hypothetical protein